MTHFQCFKPFALLLFVFLSACKTPSVSDASKVPKSYVTTTLTNNQRPKNIIFMVGDGMGLSQVSAGYRSEEHTSELQSR